MAATHDLSRFGGKSEAPDMSKSKTGASLHARNSKGGLAQAAAWKKLTPLGNLRSWNADESFGDSDDFHSCDDGDASFQRKNSGGFEIEPRDEASSCSDSPYNETPSTEEYYVHDVISGIELCSSSTDCEQEVRLGPAAVYDGPCFTVAAPQAAGYHRVGGKIVSAGLDAATAVGFGPALAAFENRCGCGNDMEAAGVKGEALKGMESVGINDEVLTAVTANNRPHSKAEKSYYFPEAQESVIEEERTLLRDEGVTTGASSMEADADAESQISLLEETNMDLPSRSIGDSSPDSATGQISENVFSVNDAYVDVSSRDASQNKTQLEYQEKTTDDSGGPFLSDANASSQGVSYRTEENAAASVILSTFRGFRFPCLSQPSQGSTDCTSPTLSSPCESPGVFFSCCTSLADIQDDLSLYRCAQNGTSPSKSQIAGQTCETAKSDSGKYQRAEGEEKSPSFQPKIVASMKQNAVSGGEKSRHSRKRRERQRFRNIADYSTDTARYREVEPCEQKPTGRTGTRTFATITVGVEDSTTTIEAVTPLSQRRDVRKSLTPLTIFQPPPARRAKSASPVPSRIPRPVLRERAIRRAPSGPSLHSDRSRATTPKQISASPDTKPRGLSRTPSLQKNPAFTDMHSRSKFISGRGGTAWTVPATNGSPSKTPTKDAGGEDFHTTYTRSTFSSTSKRRSKVFQRASSLPYRNFSGLKDSQFTLIEKSRMTSNWYYPTPPSSCPPLSPVSFPSVGSSPIVLVNQNSEENCFFPKAASHNVSSLQNKGVSFERGLTYGEIDKLPTAMATGVKDLTTKTYVGIPDSEILVSSALSGPTVTKSPQSRGSGHPESVPTLEYVSTQQLIVDTHGRDEIAASWTDADTASVCSTTYHQLEQNGSHVYFRPASPQLYSLDYVASNAQPSSLDSHSGHFQPCSLDSLMVSGYQPQPSNHYRLNPPTVPAPNFEQLYPSRGDSTYGSLPLTVDSIMEYPSSASSLPLSCVSTSAGKDDLGPCSCSFLQGQESESEDSLEDYNWIDMSGGTEVGSPIRTLRQRRHGMVHKAKLRASLAWLLSKVYGADVPREMHDPFYETSQGQLALRPVLVNMMSSSELYCQACANMFPETHAQWSGHWSIIQVLSRKGIYVADTHESAVTETVLVQTAPFKLKAHLALIDALMRAYLCEVASVEKVAKAVRNFTTFPASSELPSSPEEALKFWINKVCALVTREGVGTCHKSKQLLEGDAGQKVLVTTNTTGDGSSSEPVNVPLLQDLMSDVGDGSSVAALIAYYRPRLLNIKSICLKESIGIADSLYNLRLIAQFCRAHLPWRRFHLSYEDLLYTHTSMHINICTFLGDLFFCFEGPSSDVTNSGANAIKSAKQKIDAMPAAGKRSVPNTPVSSSAAVSSATPVPISNVTKKSFQQRASLEDTAGNLGMGSRSALPGSLPGQHQPLLPRRSGGRRSFAQDDGSGVGGLLSSSGMSGASPPTSRRGRRTVSLCSPQDRDIVQRSVLAWQDDQTVSNGHNRAERRASGGVGRAGSGNLLANVSIDSNLNRSLNTDASLSLDLGDVNTPRTGRHSALDPSHPDYLEVESVTSGQPSRFASPHSAGQPTGRSTATLVDGGGEPADRASLEPLMPAVLKPTKERDALLSKAQERGDRTPRRRKISSPTEPSPYTHQQQHPHHPHPHHQHQQQLSASGEDLGVSLSASSSETTVSPLPGEETQDQYSSQMYAGQPYGTESVDFTGELPNSARSNAFSVAESYTLQDRPNTVQEARAAGIPVVSDSLASGSTLAGRPDCSSREGSVASSGDYSDHESHKIHQDHKLRESGHHGGPDRSHQDSGLAPAIGPDLDFSDKPAMVISDHQGGDMGRNNNNNSSSSSHNNSFITSALKAPPVSNTTNFAELKRLKDNMEFNIDKVDNSALIYMQSGSHGGPYNRSPGGADLKATFLNSQGQGYGKTTTFGQLSPIADRSNSHAVNNGRSSPNPGAESNGSVMSTSDPGSSELSQLRLKLEQKRKEIERKKHRQEAQQNKMRQRLGKAAFMRVVSKHMEEGDESEEGMVDGSTGRELSPASSTTAQIQARLGINPQRQPMPRSQPAGGQTLLGSGTVPPPEASAQRFTDWRSQTQRKAGAGGASQSSEGSGAPSGTAAGGSAHAFSRAGIQQTIDNVRNKWFSGGANDSASLLVAPGLDTEDQTDAAGGSSFMLHENDLRKASPSPRVSPGRESTRPHSVIGHPSPQPSESLSVSQPIRGGSVPRQMPSPAPQPKQRRASDSTMGEVVDPHQQQYQEYDSSLDKLNSSLSDLQGEIMRLSLQHEQGKANGLPPSVSGGNDPRLSTALSAIGSTASGTINQPHPQTRPIHGIPHQAPYVLADRQQPQHQGPQKVTSVPYNQHHQQQRLLDSPGQHDLPSAPSRQQQHSIHSSPQQQPQPQEIDSKGAPPPQGKDGGFFVSFGDDSSPKRAKPKPKLGEHRSTPTATTAIHSTPPSAVAKYQQQHQPHQQQAGLWVPGPDLVPSPELDPAVAAVVAGQAVAPLTPASKADLSGEDKGGSPSVGFVIQDQTSVAVDPSAEDEMQRKKTKLMEMQRKRKEDQERKRAEKEAELARKQEEKMFKEEEQERRKAEERARRDQIFQQYLQKKAEEDVDGPPSSHSQAAARAKVKRRDRSASNSLATTKQRPKSMFVKAATPEPGALGGRDSCNSSQEDLARAAAGGRSTPGVMSAMRSAYHFRMPQQNRMRKAVSCNTLQGPGSGSHGQATFRRPPSPDLYKLKQQQRGNSQDSGSDNGSNPGSNPGSEFSGPKLYVKPSAKSNRHIIVNAISHCCLAGSVNTDMKNKVLEEMSKCDANHFLILFRDAGCQYRGLFILYPDSEEAVKVCGVGPRHITNKMCEKFYKYNSGGKSFTEIVSKKHLSVSVDAVVLLNSLWKSGKAAVKR